MYSIFILSIAALDLDKREKLLGVDAKKLLNKEGSLMNDMHSDNEENENYSFFKNKEGLNRMEDPKKERFRDFGKSLDNKKNKKDLSPKDALMTSQSSYHAPLSSILMKNDEDNDKDKDHDDIIKISKDLDEARTLLTKALGILNNNRETISNLTNKKKEDKKEKGANKARDLIDYKVIEVDDDNKK
ncbi:hypothetical protein H312_02984 [Anncaliia algerae PRA339]|uniref:Uncharacterized protein n=1 Tax=Anncaliia algerae PRA339 TaxID=1288291 RepID=A0A059EX87_9MICR|nr:hypothetical protein H312_02984 [Anncaliia algerae PRA339]